MREKNCERRQVTWIIPVVLCMSFYICIVGGQCNRERKHRETVSERVRASREDRKKEEREGEGNDKIEVEIVRRVSQGK